jgi:hypothetical protein
MIKIIQADRDAAADYVIPKGDVRYSKHAGLRKAFLKGLLDDDPAVQAFIRHRLAERARIEAWLRKQPAETNDPDRYADAIAAGKHEESSDD